MTLSASQVLLNQRLIFPNPRRLIRYPDDLCAIIPLSQPDHILAQRVCHEHFKLLPFKRPPLKLQTLLRRGRKSGMIGRIDSSEVTLGGNMRPHKTTNYLTKPQRAQIVLSDSLVPHSADRD